MDSEIEAYRDIAAHARSYWELLPVVRAEHQKPGARSRRRRAYTARLLGPTDGRTGERIASYLLGESAAALPSKRPPGERSDG